MIQKGGDMLVLEMALAALAGAYIRHRYTHRCPECKSWRRRTVHFETVSHRNSSGGIISHGGYGKRVSCRKCGIILSGKSWSTPSLYQRY